MKKLPKKGLGYEPVLNQLKASRQQDAQWSEGKTWSLVYHAGNEHTNFLKSVYDLFFHENGLNPYAFPSLKKFEAEVVAQSASLFSGDEKVCGTMTSGGSESIMMALKTYRDAARKSHPDIKNPEVILPISVHPAFNKACQYFDLKPVIIGVKSDYTVDVSEVKKAINSNTILIVGSAPCYPFGVMDPIRELASLAQSHKIGCHVDACLGGFYLPFAKQLGAPIPDFDFAVPGVTSLSADIHKYGFSAKGASVILYRDENLRRHQFFLYTEWPGGLFASPSMTGTRPGGSIAAAWATFQALGEDGYLKLIGQIMETSNAIQNGIQTVPGIRLVGKPIGPVFAFTHENLDVFAIADQLEAKGWLIDRQQNPNALHLMVTPAHTPSWKKFVSDLEAAVSMVKNHPELSQEGKAAMYGMMAHIPDRSQITHFLQGFMDERYHTESQASDTRMN